MQLQERNESPTITRPIGPNAEQPQLPQQPQQLPVLPERPAAIVPSETAAWSVPPAVVEPVSPYVQAEPPANNVRTASLLLPLLIVGLGVLFLLNTFNIVDWSVWEGAWRLWP